MAERRFCELRQVAEREIRGLAMVYGAEAEIGGFRERFAPGAFAPLGEAVLLNLSHDPKRILARGGGGGLDMEDTAEALTIRAVLPRTRDADDALEMVRKKVLTGLSIEFIPEKQEFRNSVRVVKKAKLTGVGVVANPAYSASVLREELRDEIRVAGNGEVRVAGNGLEGAFFFDRDRVISDREQVLSTEKRARSVRKRRFKPRAFDYALQALDRDIQLIMGKNWEHPLAFRMGRAPEESSALIWAELQALKFTIRDLPFTSWAKDLKASIAGSAAPYGVDVIGRIPPPEVVPNAVEIIPEPGNEEVGIEVINEFLLTGISIVSRPPRGNPGEVNLRSGSPGETDRRRRHLWL